MRSQSNDSKVTKMANKGAIVASQGEQLESVDLKKAAAMARLANRGDKAKANRASRKQNTVTVQNTYTMVPFAYATGEIAPVPMTRKVAALYKLPEMEAGQYTVSKNGKILSKGIGDFKGKTIRFSRGYVLKERKTPTKGRSTGAGGKRSISLTKSYSRVWTTMRVPLDATAIDVIHWMKGWAGSNKPDLLHYGDQYINTGLRKTKAAHKAETLAKGQQ
jgi:hypothetical protein